MEQLVKCFCGWQGYSDRGSQCPACQRPLNIIKCEGCGE